MKDKRSDINDDEIRVISSGGSRPERKKKKTLLAGVCVIAALLAAGAVVFFLTGRTAEDGTALEKDLMQPPSRTQAEKDAPRVGGPATVRKDTLVGGAELTFLTPLDATPALELGNGVAKDSAAVLIVQAADIRGDNGEIVGSCVVKGKLVSKGEAKAGFCAIINGEMSVGVADATSLFEQALMTDGYFFRQYPLVVAGQVVENKPKGKSMRRALAEADGKISVIISRNRLTFHDFSQALVDVGVRNAIYLVGGKAYGRYVDAAGETIAFGQVWDKVDNVNYLVWR